MENTENQQQSEVKEDDLDTQTSKYINLNEGGELVIKEAVKEDMKDLSSKKTWKQLRVPENFRERLVQLGFSTPSKIQASVIPISKRSSVFAQSQNGSGKTLSFLIPALMEIDLSIDTSISGKGAPQVIILADTRPLIQQIEKIANLVKEGVYDDIKIKSFFSGVKDYDTSCHILITTIGFLANMFNKRKSIKQSNVSLFIIDEADLVMKSDISNVFLPQLIIKGFKEEVRLLLTTATSTEISKNFITKVQDYKQIITIELEKEQLTLKNVHQIYMRCELGDRLPLLDKVLEKLSAQNILIFTNSKRALRDTVEHLCLHNHKAVGVSSNNMEDKVAEAKKNQESIAAFLAGKFRILVTTNLLSRGIDMRKVTLVVNLELPKNYQNNQVHGMGGRQDLVDCETYLHRVGRTGRFGDHGIAMNFVIGDMQESMRKQVVDFYKINMTQININELNKLNTILDEIGSFNKVKRQTLAENI